MVSFHVRFLKPSSIGSVKKRPVLADTVTQARDRRARSSLQIARWSGFVSRFFFSLPAAFGTGDAVEKGMITSHSAKRARLQIGFSYSTAHVSIALFLCHKIAL